MITWLWGCIQFWHMIHTYHMPLQDLRILYISTACVKTLLTQRTMCNSHNNIYTMWVQTLWCVYNIQRHVVVMDIYYFPVLFWYQVCIMISCLSGFYSIVCRLYKCHTFPLHVLKYCKLNIKTYNSLNKIGTMCGQTVWFL